MGLNSSKIKKVNFEDIQNLLLQKDSLLISTLSVNEQDCLIYSTLSYEEEEKIINNLLNTNKSKRIIIYGKNTNDKTAYKKYLQLIELGFEEVYLYPGGLFEWLCLQDIYSDDNFKTTVKELDILKFKPISDFT